MRATMRLGVNSACVLGLALSLASAPVRADSGVQKTELSETFTTIWRENGWEDSISRSGPGSTLEATAHVRAGLESILHDYAIASILDTACGDFGWMDTVNLQGATYLGLDIVPELIADNRARYADYNGTRQFAVADMTQCELPKSDLVIARDVLGHLSFAHGLRALQNIRASGATWFLSTTFVGHRTQEDIPDGRWRPVDLSAWPYNLGAPTKIILEHCTAADGSYADKALGLWPIARLPR